MPELMPHQEEGAAFLASRTAALLADEQRVGKTATAIEACDRVGARTILVVTTASGRPVWGRAFRDWSARTPNVIYDTSGRGVLSLPVAVISWAAIAKQPVLASLLVREWDVLVLDESHYAKNPEAKRTEAAFALAKRAKHVWALSGTPVPNAPNDLFPLLESVAKDRLEARNGFPEVTAYYRFVSRYCTTKPIYIAGRRKDVVTGGKNLDELGQRIEGFWLRRTQKDVGIQPPIFELLPLHVDNIPAANVSAEAREILDAAEQGATRELEMHLGTLRRLTGDVKAQAVASAVREEFECGLDRIVLMCWHRHTIALLAQELAEFHPVTLEGSTPPAVRELSVQLFTEGRAKVFIGQILAAGEAIDLSAACELIFVEPSFVPKDMSQAALRITNLAQKRQCRVRVAALEGSIDEAVCAVLTRKVASIAKLLGQQERMSHAS